MVDQTVSLPCRVNQRQNSAWAACNFGWISSLFGDRRRLILHASSNYNYSYFIHRKKRKGKNGDEAKKGETSAEERRLDCFDHRMTVTFPRKDVVCQRLTSNRFLLGLNGAVVLYYFFVHEMALLVEALNILLNGI